MPGVFNSLNRRNYEAKSAGNASRTHQSNAFPDPIKTSFPLVKPCFLNR
jgi:hypothetical protein